MMNTRMVLTIALSVVLGAPVLADDLPSARSLIDRHIEAMGGRDAVLAQTDSTMTGTFRMPGAGMEGQLVIASRAPNERVMRISLPGVGEMLTGYASDISWSMDPFTGPRLLEGAELQAQVEQSEPGAIMRDPAFLDSVETTGTGEVDDQACYRVRLEWKSGRESVDCYATESGLLIGMETTQPSPMGDIEALMVVEAYKRIEGVMVATRSRIDVMGQTQILEIDSVEFETPDEALFERPAAIQGLIEQRGGQ